MVFFSNITSCIICLVINFKRDLKKRDAGDDVICAALYPYVPINGWEKKCHFLISTIFWPISMEEEL